jgi:hypothetical protein
MNLCSCRVSFFILGMQLQRSLRDDIIIKIFKPDHPVSHPCRQGCVAPHGEVVGDRVGKRII